MSDYPLLSESGPFAEQLAGFNSRPVQQELAVAIDMAFNNQQSLVAEAGTGIGKTFAYLVPAIMSQNKCIISTATKNLQEQLYHKDIPKVCEILDVSPKLALLKGRANYLCTYRMERAQEEGRFASKQAARDLQLIRKWTSSTKSGDLSEVWQLAEDADILPSVTSTADNCLSLDCPDYDDCYVLKARQYAQQADILVINHHLLCADLSLKDEGFGELLPDVEHIIVDEAHRLSDTLSLFFGRTFSSRQVVELAADMRKEYLTESTDLSQLQQWAGEFEERIKACREEFQEEPTRGSLNEILSNQDLHKELQDLLELFDEARKQLEPISESTRGLESCYQRLERCYSLLKSILAQSQKGLVYWFELFRHTFVIHQTPILIDEIFQEQWQNHGGSWIFTSATLSVGNDLSHFKNTLGLVSANEICLSSPFDYAQQAVAYLPKNLPSPSQPDHAEQLMAEILPVLQANEGRCFCLFTSYRALHKAAEWLSVNSQFTLLIQGSADKSALLDKFITTKNCLLLGTSSFWEGVDVRGAELSCVVIDKLPFAVPSDPVLKARIDASRERGEKPFFEIQLPYAVLALKQGAGRLIRDMTDQGVLILGDNRLIRKNYGASFIKSLPDMHRTRNQNRVIDFIEGMHQ